MCVHCTQLHVWTDSRKDSEQTQKIRLLQKQNAALQDEKVKLYSEREKVEQARRQLEAERARFLIEQAQLEAGGADGALEEAGYTTGNLSASKGLLEYEKDVPALEDQRFPQEHQTDLEAGVA